MPPPCIIQLAQATGCITVLLQDPMRRMMCTLTSAVEDSLHAVFARLILEEVSSLQAMGAAVSGRRTRWTGAQPRSYTHAPRLPARAVLGAAGSGGSWPRPRLRWPSPRGHVSRQWRTAAAVLCSAMLSGHCRCYRAAETSVVEAFGGVGFGWPGDRLPSADAAALAKVSSGTRTWAVAPLSPSSGCCRRYRATDASGLEAVGRFGVGLLGVWREVVAAALLADVFLAAPLGTTLKLLTISGSCSLYHAVEALSWGAVGGGGGGMLGPRREVIAASAAATCANIGLLATTWGRVVTATRRIGAWHDVTLTTVHRGGGQRGEVCPATLSAAVQKTQGSAPVRTLPPS